MKPTVMLTALPLAPLAVLHAVDRPAGTRTQVAIDPYCVRSIRLDLDSGKTGFLWRRRATTVSHVEHPEDWRANSAMTTCLRRIDGRCLLYLWAAAEAGADAARLTRWNEGPETTLVGRASGGSIPALEDPGGLEGAAVHAAGPPAIRMRGDA